MKRTWNGKEYLPFRGKRQFLSPHLKNIYRCFRNPQCHCCSHIPEQACLASLSPSASPHCCSRSARPLSTASPSCPPSRLGRMTKTPPRTSVSDVVKKVSPFPRNDETNQISTQQPKYERDLCETSDDARANLPNAINVGDGGERTTESAGAGIHGCSSSIIHHPSFFWLNFIFNLWGSVAVLHPSSFILLTEFYIFYFCPNHFLPD